MMKGMAFSLITVNKVSILKKKKKHIFSVLCGNLDGIGKFLFDLQSKLYTEE